MILIKKFYTLLFCVSSICILLTSNNANALTLKTDEQKQSYALGTVFAKEIGQINITIDNKAFLEGVKAQMGLSKKILSQDEINQAIGILRQRMQRPGSQQMAIQKNTEEGKKYMASNRKIKGVKVTQTGLQYKIIRLGQGAKPKVTDSVEVHYQGTFINGEEFDSSYKRQQTATFHLNQVIAGWTEVLQLMPVGSKFKVVIPGNLAYGERARPSIGPNRTLLFNIELISIK